jgi:RNA polymerase sigma factor (sigma-70 family)
VLQTLDVTSEAPAFGDFFAEHYGRLARACLLLTGNAAEGEDLAQAAMARVLERWDRVSTLEDPEGYLYRTALNLHRNAVRRMAMAARRQVHRELPEESDASERRLDLLRAIRSLPRTQREVLVLVEWLGYTAEEAGRMLGIEAVSVRGRLHRRTSSRCSSARRIRCRNRPRRSTPRARSRAAPAQPAGVPYRARRRSGT